MTTNQQVEKTQGFLLNDNSIVNINGVRARLQVDPITGCIHVHHLDKDADSEHEGTPLINDNLTLQNDHSTTNHTSHQNLPSISQDNFEDRGTGLAIEPKVVYQETAGTSRNNDQAIPESSSDFQHQFRQEHKGNSIGNNALSGLDSRADQSNTDEIHSIPDPGLGTTQDMIEPHSCLNKFSQAHLDITSIRADQHLDREVLEQDLLEQFLSSVTQDFSFSGSIPTEPPNSSSIEQGLFLPGTKSDVNSLIASDHMKRIPVSPYTFFADSDLKPTESVSKKSTKLHPILPLVESDVEKHASLNNWTLQSDRLESIPQRQAVIGNQDCRGEFKNQISIKDKSCHRKGHILKKRGRKPKLGVAEHKLKLIRPKPNIQNVILLNMTPVLPLNIAKPNSTVPLQTLLSTSTGMSSTQTVVPTGMMQANTVLLANQIPTNTLLSTAPIPQNSLKLEKMNHDADNNSRLQVGSDGDHTSDIRAVSMATCPVCQVSTTLQEYRCHLLTHPNVCAVCEMVFKVEEHLFQHLTNHNIEVMRDEDNIAELKCRLCQAQFLHPGNVQRHILSHCGSMSTGNACLPSSVKVSTGNEVKKNARLKKAVCHKCGKLLNPKCLAVHVKSHCPADDPGRQTNPMHCNVCRSLFRNLSTLKRHLPSCRGSLALNTLQQETVTCDACMRTISVHSLTTHKRLYCSAANPKSQNCPFCDTKLKHKHSLRNHIRWHCKKSPGAESPTQCVCGKVFRNYKAFQSHYTNHCLVRAPLSVI